MSTTPAQQEFHNGLLDQLESVSQWWPDASQATVSALNVREVLAHLTELRDELKTHFALEEDHGLIPGDSASDPQLESKADDLLKQHAGLLERLNSLTTSIPVTSEKPSAWSAAKGHFDDFRKALDRHERAEIELLQAVGGENLGVGD